jgi:hypothetical protein
VSRSRFLAIARLALLIWGAVSFVGVLVLVGMLVWPGNQLEVDRAAPKDVHFVLNGCGLGEERVEKVLHSHVSGRSITGDHLEAYAIRVTRLDGAELLTKGEGDPLRSWFRGDRLPPMLAEAMHDPTASAGEIPWFPSEAELRSTEVYVSPRRFLYHGMRLDGVDFIVARPADRTIFYFSSKV